MVRKQRKASFIDKHCDQYGLKIVTRGPKGNVASVVCRFCATFGREDDNDDCGVGNNNANCKEKEEDNECEILFIFSFRTTDNYKTHLETHNIHRNGLSIRRSNMNLMPLPIFFIWACHLQTHWMFVLHCTFFTFLNGNFSNKKFWIAYSCNTSNTLMSNSCFFVKTFLK